jgi:hypothetical protein
MTWRAPAVTRIDEPFASRPVARSDLSLLGLVRHVADVERWWLGRRFVGEELRSMYADAFGDIRPEDAEADYHRLVDEWTAVNLDGGGSTTMSVAGMLVNHPSGATERAVGDALVYVDAP